MQIQPLLLTRPVVLPGTIPGTARSAPSSGVSAAGGCSGCSGCSDCQGTDAASGDAGSEDTLEISAEAEAALTSQLTEEEQQQVQDLKARDREVRTHEQAHLAAAGQYAVGGPTFDYQQGPDGQRYAIGGEVQIDTSAVPGDPEATIRKARAIRAAALAPADPSSQDRSVAASAAQLEAQARRDLGEQQSQRAGQTSSAENPLSPDAIAQTYGVSSTGPRFSAAA